MHGGDFLPARDGNRKHSEVAKKNIKHVIPLDKTKSHVFFLFLDRLVTNEIILANKNNFDYPFFFVGRKPQQLLRGHPPHVLKPGCRGNTCSSGSGCASTASKNVTD